VYEIALLIECHLHHALPAIRVERREDPSVDAEVGVRHVRAFDSVLEAERNLPEIVGCHAISVEEDRKKRLDVALVGSSGMPAPSTPAFPYGIAGLMFLDRPDPKMSAGSSPAGSATDRMNSKQSASVNVQEIPTFPSCDDRRSLPGDRLFS